MRTRPVFLWKVTFVNCFELKRLLDELHSERERTIVGLPYSYINFQGTYILRILQIQHFHSSIFEDHWPDFVNDYASRIEFQGLNFCGMHVILEKSDLR